MAQKTYSKHSEYKTYATKGNYDEGDFETMKAELLPSKYGSLVQPGNGIPPANKEYYYEYKEEKNPAGTYDRKDLKTVEQYEFSHNPTNKSYTPQRALPSSISTTTSNTRRGELTQNIEELDSLLDDLQKDQERKPYKSGYSSDTMESSSFDYRTSVTPVKSSGYSSLSKVDRDVGWIPAPQPGTVSREVNREIIRNQVTESHMVPAVPQTVPAIVCEKCHGHPVELSGVPMNKVTTTVKTYTYEVPAGQDPTLVALPGVEPLNSASTTTHEKYLTTDRSYVKENQDHRTYVNTQFNTSTPVGSPIRHPSPAPATHYHESTTTYPVNTSQTHIVTTNNNTTNTCPNCSHKITTRSVQNYTDAPKPYSALDTTKVTTRNTQYTTNTVDNRYPDRSPYPGSTSPHYAVPVDSTPKQPHQGPSGPPGSSVYKYTTTNYTYNTSNVDGPHGPATPPFPVDGPRASPFPRTESPAPRNQEPPKRLDDLLADFPGHEHYPPDHDGLRKRPNPARGPGGAINGQISVQEKAMVQNQAGKAQEQKVALSPSRNIAGPAVYYPPGHEMFVRKDEAAAYQQAGGGYMKGKGMYKYEAESSSKSKSSSGAAVVPVCLPLCCAMPCVLL